MYVRNHVRNKLGSWRHRSLEEVDDNGIEPILELGVTPERLLEMVNVRHTDSFSCVPKRIQS